MKKNFKRFVALTMALSTLGAVSAFAGPSVTKLTGSISSTDIQVSITLPATGTLTMQPYKATQINTGASATATAPLSAQNTATDLDYVITLSGYSAVATSKNADDAMSITSTAKKISEYTGTKKEISLKFQMIAGSAAETDYTKIGKYDSTDTAKKEVLLNKLSEADYDVTNAESTYTKVAVTDKSNEIKVEKKQFLSFAVVGTMNPAADWAEGDSLSVIPVFTVLPSVPTA